MLQIPKFWGKLAFLAALSAILMFLLNLNETREEAWQLIKSEEVLDRIGAALTEPIKQLSEQQHDATQSPVHTQYNFNLYAVYGKKLMDYSDTLTRQSSITLGPLTFGELDFFNRRLYDQLYDLYRVGQDEAIDPSRLDLNELEQVLYSSY